ncbi:MAG: YicC family protein [Verrucomicrobiota bacterium]|nr:YicC family protein [Verrucomicrobiota bacterium]
MIASMTGFGRAVEEAPFGKLVVEIQSVNRKYLEVFVSLPKEWSRFENEVRKLVQGSALRGFVTVRVTVTPGAAALEGILPDKKALLALKKGWEKLAVSLGYPKECIDLPFLLQQMGESPSKETDFAPLKKGLEKALVALVEMKKTEGRALTKDVGARLDLIGRLVESVEKAAPDAVAKQRQKLKERMEEVLVPHAELDERLLREVALFAEKVDISEEIIRLKSHLSQYRDVLKGKGEGAGRKMEFLVQEMGREINTIGSKSMDAKISHLVVEAKSELEKVREQIQNIE